MDETFLENSSQFPVKDGVLNISQPHEDGRSEAEILIGEVYCVREQLSPPEEDR